MARCMGDGRLNLILPGTFLVGIDPSRAPRELIRVAALVRGGELAMLDGTSALERRGIWDRHDGTIHVATPRGVHHSPLHRVRFHRVEAGRIRGSKVEHVPTRNAFDALFAASEELDEYQLAYAIWRAEYRTGVTLDRLEKRLADQPRSRGNATMRAALELRRAGSVGTKSRSEDMIRRPIHAMFGTPLVNVVGSAGILGYEPDLCFPLVRWIIEIDGGHHLDDPRIVELDRVRDELLRSTGWQVDRIPWNRIHHDLPGVMAELKSTARCLRGDRPALIN
ncbi:MAG: hypothetical protein JWM25_379 [Thermoleophilia bacterium]|nr:hypothetical protein [Thermoleophilia bacterium]